MLPRQAIQSDTCRYSGQTICHSRIDLLSCKTVSVGAAWGSYVQNNGQ